MLSVITRAAALAVVVFLSACAGAPERAAPESLAGIKKVGVVSLTGHEFYRRYTGLTAFGNESEKQDITAWKIDDEYEAQIGAALTSLARFEAVRVPYERKAFYRVYELNKAKWSAVEEEAKAFAAKNSVDAILVVVRRESGDFLTGSNQNLQGAGFYARGMGGVTGVSVLHLVAAVALIDGKTGKPLVVKDLSRDPKTLSAAKATPHQPVPAELARTKLSALDAARTEQLRVQLIDLPKNAWEPTLKALLAP